MLCPYDSKAKTEERKAPIGRLALQGKAKTPAGRQRYYSYDGNGKDDGWKPFEAQGRPALHEELEL